MSKQLFVKRFSKASLLPSMMLPVMLATLMSTAVAHASDHGHGKGHDKAQVAKAAHAAPHAAPHGGVKGRGLGLTPDLRQLLSQEMLQIKGAMESLVLATVTANWGQISAIGQQIEHSFILKQKLTAQQHHQLHEKLPAEFVQLDQQLHQYAGMLAHVAQARDIELVNFYTYKMLDTCTSCHRRFVTDKFGGFALPSKHQGEAHVSEGHHDEKSPADHH